MENIKDVIKERVSVRTFDADRTVGKLEIDALKEAIAGAISPFGGRYRIDLKEFDLKGPQRPSTYGTIAGARWYLLMGIHEDGMSALSAGYAMEQVVLKATELGLGTCWMALTFKGSDFIRNSPMPEDEPLRIVSPVGYPARKRRLLESLTRATIGSARRKPMNDLFSWKEFGNPLPDDNMFHEALAMMRLAPSAKNTQPWRALVQEDTVWFYYERKSEASVLDLGIGLCHFALTLQANGCSGEWSESVNAPAHPGYIPAVKFTLAR